MSPVAILLLCLLLILIKPNHFLASDITKLVFNLTSITRVIKMKFLFASTTLN